MKNLNIYIITLIATLFASCKNELKVLAPGKEMVSVYGVLNPNEAVQNIRINKVFVTTGDANVAATNANEVNYNAGELIVTLERYNTGSTVKQLTTQGNSVKKEIILTETVVTTASGAFSNQQRIWQTTDRLYPSGEYKLIIKKASDNTELASAQTLMIDSVKPLANVMPFCVYVHPSNPNLSYPVHFPTNQFAYPNDGSYILDSPPGTGTKQIAYVDYSVLTKNQTIKFNTVANAKLYTVTVRFHYIDTLLSGGTQNGYADFNLQNYVPTKTTAGEAVSAFQFTAKDFYDNLGLEMAKKGNQNIKKRSAHYIEYIVSATTDNLYTFLQVNAPSTTIAQDKPYYTNVTNGVGIFACRSASSITKDLWSDFISKIACYPATYPYLFCNFTSGNPASSPCP